MKFKLLQGGAVPKQAIVWGPLIEDKGPLHLETMRDVYYSIFMAKGVGRLRTECDLEKDGV